MASYLKERGQTVESTLCLSPDEADEFTAPAETFSMQAHFASDGVSLSMRLSGVDVYANFNYMDGKDVKSGGHTHRQYSNYDTEAYQNNKPPGCSGGLWCGAGSNRRHKDFQSFALPTELPHHNMGGKNKGILYIQCLNCHIHIKI